MHSCGLVSNPELKPVLESALARNQPNHIQRRIKGRGGIENATEAYLATTAFGRFSVVYIFCVGLDCAYALVFVAIECVSCKSRANRKNKEPEQWRFNQVPETYCGPDIERRDNYAK
jgi:hypothetical protein